MRVEHTVKFVTDIDEAKAPQGALAQLNAMSEETRTMFFQTVALEVLKNEFLPKVNAGNSYAQLRVESA
jgi:hypothetical protein